MGGREGEVNVMKGKFRSNFYETFIPSPLGSKKLKERHGNLTNTKQANNSNGESDAGISGENATNLEKAENKNNLKEKKGVKVNGKKEERTQATIETLKEAPKGARDAKKLKNKEASENDTTKKGDGLAKTGKATLIKASGVKTLSNDTNGKFRLSLNGSISIGTNKDGKPKSVNLKIKPNDQLKDEKSSMSQTLSQAQKSSKVQNSSPVQNSSQIQNSSQLQKLSQVQKSSQNQAPSLSEDQKSGQVQNSTQNQAPSLSEEKSKSTEKESSLEKDLLMKKFKARLDYETRSCILIPRSTHSFLLLIVEPVGLRGRAGCPGRRTRVGASTRRELRGCLRLLRITRQIRITITIKIKMR